MSNYYFLGIDGGGTKTKSIIINEKKEIVYEGQGGPSSLDTVSNYKTLESINQSLEKFFKNNNNIIFKAVFAGLGGILDEEYEITLSNLLTHIKGVNDETIVVGKSDMENALYSGLCFFEGMSLIAGTGMVCFGKNKQGDTKKTGGLGYKEGDFGSSYDLGKKCLQALARSSDGRYEKNDFTDEIANLLNVSTPSDVARVCEELYEDRTRVASFAPIVTKHANLGNIYATKIVEDATYELALCIKTVYKYLKLDKTKLVIVGSLGNSSGLFRDRLLDKIKLISNNIEVIKPVIDPAHAASIMAYEIWKNN